MVHKPKTIEQQWGKEHIIELFYCHRGKLSLVAKALGCHSRTVYSFIDRDDEAKAALEDSRKIAREDRIDDCETYAETIAERFEDDASNGLKAAMYFLNTHGAARGYGKDVVNVHEELEKLRSLLADKIGDPPKPVVE